MQGDDSVNGINSFSSRGGNPERFMCTLSRIELGLERGEIRFIPFSIPKSSGKPVPCKFCVIYGAFHSKINK